MTSVSKVIDLETAQDLGLGILLEEARAAGGELKLVDNSNQVIATLLVGEPNKMFTGEQLKALEAVQVCKGGGIHAIKWLRENYKDDYLGLKEAKLLIDWAVRTALSSALKP